MDRAWGNPVRVTREVISLSFRGSRSELANAAALRLRATILLLFLAVRCIHLAQAGVDLVLAGNRYTVGWLAIGLGAICLLESLAFAGVTLAAGRLTERAVLADAAFGVFGLAVMAAATHAGPSRAGSLNWMLPYTVATATALGVLTGGDLVRAGPPGGHEANMATSRTGAWGRRRLWPLAAALGLAGAFVASAYLPHRLAEDGPSRIWGDAGDYGVFFLVGAFTIEVTRRQVGALARRNEEVRRAAAGLAREAQWRAVVADVFGPALDLLDRVSRLPDGEVPPQVSAEAARLIVMIDAVRPGTANRPIDSSASWDASAP